MQAEQVLRQFLLQHFGTYQSGEIKASKVTEFCWGKKKEKKRKEDAKTNQSLESWLCTWIVLIEAKNFLAWKYLLCANHQKKKYSRKSTRIDREICSRLLSCKRTVHEARDVTCLEVALIWQECTPLDPTGSDLQCLSEEEQLWSLKLTAENYKVFCSGVAAKLECQKTNW